MAKGFKVTEETPDRNYFTIVPNYIVNHSTIYEQGIYLVMKRIAGEQGNCYASHQTIADKAGISRPTVSKTIQKLIKRNWIRETGVKSGRTLSTKQYQIVDLWELNNKFYKDQKSDKDYEQLAYQEGKEVEEAVNHRTASDSTISKDSKLSTTEQLSCKPPLHKEDIYIKKNNTLKSIKGINPLVERILKEFKETTKLSQPSDPKPRQWAYMFATHKGVDHFLPCLEFLQNKRGLTITKIEAVYRQFPLYEREVVNKKVTDKPEAFKGFV